MLAIQAVRAGGPEVLEAVELERPTPGPGQVLVRHEAIGLNFIDTYQRSGLYPMRYPAVLGQEAAGVVEAIFCVLALRDQVAPATINYDHPDPDCDLDYVPNVARPMRIDVAVSNSFGFGGTNGTLVLRRLGAL